MTDTDYSAMEDLGPEYGGRPDKPTEIIEEVVDMDAVIEEEASYSEVKTEVTE